MDLTRLERSRRLLKTRVERAENCPPALFPENCHQLLTWLRSHPIFQAMLAQLHPLPERATVLHGRIIQAAREGRPPGPIHHIYEGNQRSLAALFLATLEAIASIRGFDASIQNLIIGNISATLAGPDAHHKPLDKLRLLALRGFYEYLSEEAELGYGIIESVLRYKQRSEWFRRDRLRNVVLGLEGKKGERALAVDLYEYVFDNNLEFIIEPTSGSGEVDMVLRAPSGQLGIIDAKYLDDPKPSAVKNKLSTGFHQVARYCSDYNEPFGVLAAFINIDPTPRIHLEHADGLSFLFLHGRRIYYVPIDISDRPSASKAGKALEIELKDLLDSSSP